MDDDLTEMLRNNPCMSSVISMSAGISRLGNKRDNQAGVPGHR